MEDQIANLQATVILVLGLIASIVSFFIIVKIVKWIQGGESLDQKITRRGNQYGRYADGPYGHDNDGGKRGAMRREFK